MYAAYTDLPNASDLCCYWFELGRRSIEHNPGTRCGLLATQGIRGGANRTVLERIKQTGDIFMAWSDREWILDGAAVHVSMVAFGNDAEQTRTLDGECVDDIAADLCGDVGTVAAVQLPENAGLTFMGDTKGGAFDIDWSAARRLLTQPNPSDRTNADVLRPWVNGLDYTRRARSKWIVDFGCTMGMAEAAAYEGPFEYVEQSVRPTRIKNRRESYARRWWLHVEPRPAMRKRLPRSRFVVTPILTKHRLFVFVEAPTLPDHQLIAFARSDDYVFGMLHSSIHELWARRMGTQLREVESGFRYTPTTCFETFPLPWPPGKEDTRHAAYRRIDEAAVELNAQRERWLNPPEWIDLIARAVDGEDDFADVPADARPLIRHSAIMAEAAQDARLRKRTLTNLYNERPTWLRLAHERLDRAVLAAYAATDPEGNWSEDWADVWVETGAGQPLPRDEEDAPHPLAERRKETDQLVLANLLRLNLARAGSP